jgi:hypothetical protein
MQQHVVQTFITSPEFEQICWESERCEGETAGSCWSEMRLQGEGRGEACVYVLWSLPTDSVSWRSEPKDKRNKRKSYDLGTTMGIFVRILNMEQNLTKQLFHCTRNSLWHVRMRTHARARARARTHTYTTCTYRILYVQSSTAYMLEF